ncbi:GNAT family N-acetyltransferase [Paludibacterium purpuratum]|nr:GNAT family N-acetyltransferase [Paludibacterium purpuratum]
MATSDVVLTLAADADEDARRLISDRLDAFNVEETGIADNQPLDVLVSDPVSGQCLGGLVGRTSLGVLFVNYVYLPESLRGQGLGGGRLLAIAESEACRRGCREALLFTMEIQAPGFYLKQGYREFGRIECQPAGNARVFLRKTLI